jgi:predicted DsbA family dithiol-disulfide isomerase
MWCSLAEDALERLESHYGQRVEFAWELAVIERGRALGDTLATEQWYYDRCAYVTGRRFNPNWVDGLESGSYFANAAVEATRLLGVTDGSVRRAMARAACVDGRKVCREAEAIAIAAAAGGFLEERVRDALRDPRVAQRLDAASTEFEALGADQRPTLVITNAIGDKVLLIGVYQIEPIEAALEALLHDESRYAAFAQEHAPFPAVQDAPA